MMNIALWRIPGSSDLNRYSAHVIDRHVHMPTRHPEQKQVKTQLIYIIYYSIIQYAEAIIKQTSMVALYKAA